MLDKRGNSNSKERIELVNRFIRLFGKEVIESIVADREFLGGLACGAGRAACGASSARGSGLGCVRAAGKTNAWSSNVH